MKRGIIEIILLICILLMTGCGPNIREYVSVSRNYSTLVAATGTVSVTIEPRDVVKPTSNSVLDVIGGAVNVAASIGAAAMSNEQTKRLHSLISSKEMAMLMSNGFEDSFTGTTHLEAVDNNQNPDLRIHLTLDDYGIWAESIMSPMNFYVEAQIEIIDSATMTRVYHNGISMMREASSMFSEIASMMTEGVEVEVHGAVPRVRKTRAALNTVDNVGHLVSGAASLSAFLQLTDEEISMIFKYLAFDSGVVVSEDLLRAIYR